MLMNRMSKHTGRAGGGATHKGHTSVVWFLFSFYFLFLSLDDFNAHWQPTMEQMDVQMVAGTGAVEHKDHLVRQVREVVGDVEEDTILFGWQLWYCAHTQLSMMPMTTSTKPSNRFYQKLPKLARQKEVRPLALRQRLPATAHRGVAVTDRPVVARRGAVHAVLLQHLQAWQRPHQLQARPLPLLHPFSPRLPPSHPHPQPPRLSLPLPPLFRLQPR